MYFTFLSVTSFSCVMVNPIEIISAEVSVKPGSMKKITRDAPERRGSQFQITWVSSKWSLDCKG